MRRLYVGGLAASALFIAALVCHDSIVKPLPVSAAQAQPESVKTITSSTTAIVVTDEKLAGYVVATDTNTLLFESDGSVSYSVVFPTKDPTKYPPACDPAIPGIMTPHPVKPGQSFSCAVNPAAKSGGRVFYKLKDVKKVATPAPPPAPSPTPAPAAPPPPAGQIPFSVVHCNHC
jgi:hypothetical protein